MKKGKLIVVSNRGPYKLSRTKNGLKRTKTIGGLVTSVLPMMKKYGGVWVAWGEPEVPGRRRPSGFHLALPPAFRGTGARLLLGAFQYCAVAAVPLLSRACAV
jgi:hypothetical protein